MRNIAIVGKMGSGKSSLANYLIDVQGYTRVANAGALKSLAAMAYGPIDKSEVYCTTDPDGLQEERSGRQILQDLGQIVKEFDRDFWIKAMVQDMGKKSPPFVCDDTRFPFESNYLRGAGWIIVKLYVPKDIRAERYLNLYGRYPSDAELFHPSETEVDKIQEDLGLSGQESIQTLVEQIYAHLDWRDNNDEGT